jgi:hypothetical protein
VIGCHRQSPLQPRWLAGGRSGAARFIPGVLPESFFDNASHAPLTGRKAPWCKRNAPIHHDAVTLRMTAM